MNTKFFAKSPSTAAALRAAETPSLAAPVELAAAELHQVGGGGAPRGGWLTTSDSTLTTTDATTDAPRGGWL